jgi:hypothetical protein
MTLANKRFGIVSLLRPMGLFLIILMIVFQLIAPVAAAAASMNDSQEDHHEMVDAARKCPMQVQESDADGEAELDGSDQSAAHCMPSMCCFHDTASSSKLVAVGMLLPGAQIIDRGKALSSNAGSTQERPPRHL